MASVQSHSFDKMVLEDSLEFCFIVMKINVFIFV
jgi:hypothetical protein